MEVTNSPELSVVEPQSVPSRISVVLVEEAKVGGTQCLGYPHVDHDLRCWHCCWLVCCRWPVVPYGTLSPFVSESVGPVGLYVAGGPVGPYGTLSPFDSEPVGPVGPYVAGGPVGPYGTLSPSDSEPVGPVGLYVAGDPVGPYGTLSPFSPGSVGPLGPVGPGGTLSSPILPEYCFRPCLLGYCPQRALFETIDGMTVYYGSNLCDSDESDWDDPYDIASAEYVEQYNFDVAEGMDLMVFERCRGPYGSEMLEDEGTGLAHVCQTSLSYPQGELDTFVTAGAVPPNVRSGSEIYDYGTVLSEEGDVSDSDDWSIEDHERNSWVNWCNSVFRNRFSIFPSDADDPQPMVVFSDKLFSDEVLADTPVSVHEEMPMLALQVVRDEGVPLVPPVIDQTVRRIKDELISEDKRMDEVSVFPLPIYDPPIHSGTLDMGLSHGDTKWFCLLYSAGAGSVDNGPWRLDWTARAWIIGEESSGTLVSWVNNAYTCVMIASV